MTLTDYLASLTTEQRVTFAERARTKVSYLPQITGGHRTPSPSLCHRLVAASDGAVTLAELRPDIWGNGVAA